LIADEDKLKAILAALEAMSVLSPDLDKYPQTLACRFERSGCWFIRCAYRSADPAAAPARVSQLTGRRMNACAALPAARDAAMDRVIEFFGNHDR